MAENKENPSDREPEFKIADWVKVEQRNWPLAEQDPLSPWKVNVIAVASHPGGAQALSPLINALVGKGTECQFITSRPDTKEYRAEGATGIVEQFPFTASHSPSVEQGFPDILRFSSEIPNLVLFGATDGEEAHLEYKVIMKTIEAQKSGKAVILAGVEDNTPGLKPMLVDLLQQRIPWNRTISALFLASSLSEPQYRKDDLFPYLEEEKYICVGPPGFDVIHFEDTRLANQVVRQKLRISPGDIVISHFAARGTDQYGSIEIEATRTIGEAASRLANNYSGKNFIFIHRMHPGDRDPRILYEVLASIPNIPKNLKILPNHQSRQLDTRIISAASNLSVSTFSTALTSAALRGARNDPYNYTGQMPLYYFNQSAREAFRNLKYEDPPTIQVGAAAVAYEEPELVPTMTAALFDPNFRSEIFTRQNQDLGKIYHFRGKTTATERTLHQVRLMLNKHLSAASASHSLP
ncbi:MAG: hypothetical protein HY602_01265 [Parcubacteria group bacterium]|nr:hypothetical protein [Parcubacteria group bacterium]